MEASKKDIEKIMKEPACIESTDYEEKIRRNLLFASAISFCFTYLKLMPAKDSPFMGLKFENLTPETIYLLLFIFVIYQLLQYSWIVSNKFLYWRVRLTGINKEISRGSRGGFFAEEIVFDDYTGKPENSNFYTWMLENKSDIQDKKNSMNKAWLELESYAYNSSELERRDILKTLNDILNKTHQLDVRINNLRISASMKRFDSWFEMLIKSQSIRWLVFDFVIPISVGLIAVILLIQKLIF